MTASFDTPIDEDTEGAIAALLRKCGVDVPDGGAEPRLRALAGVLRARGWRVTEFGWTKEE